MKKRVSLFLLFTLLVSSFALPVYGEQALEYEGYKKAYYDKLVDFRASDELLDGERALGKDAALLSYGKGDIPALFTISYFKGDNDKEVYNYRYRIYIYEDGDLKPVRLSENIIDNDADYNFYSENVAGDNPDVDRNDYYIARDKKTDETYLLSHMENFQEPMFSSDDEYYEEWAKDGYREENYRLEDYRKDLLDGGDIVRAYLSRETNPSSQTRYYYKDRNVKKISKQSFESYRTSFKKDYSLRLLGPGKLDDGHIRRILLEDRDIKIAVDNRLINLNTSAIIRNDRTLVPVRSIFEALDMDLEWDSKNQLVKARKDDRLIEIRINSRLAKIDGREVKLDTEAIIENDRTLVPVRFIGEAIGAKVDWNKKDRMVIIDLK